MSHIRLVAVVTERLFSGLPRLQVVRRGQDRTRREGYRCAYNCRHEDVQVRAWGDTLRGSSGMAQSERNDAQARVAELDSIRS